MLKRVVKFCIHPSNALHFSYTFQLDLAIRDFIIKNTVDFQNLY